MSQVGHGHNIFLSEWIKPQYCNFITNKYYRQLFRCYLDYTKPSSYPIIYVFLLFNWFLNHSP